MNKNIENLLAFLANLAQVLTFIGGLVLFVTKRQHLARIVPFVSRVPRFALKHWAHLCAIFVWGATVVSGYLSQKPINIVIVVMLTCLIVPPHIHGSRIWRRNSQNVVEELVRHLLLTIGGYIGLLVIPCAVILLLNPSVENFHTFSMLPNHVVNLLSPMMVWAAIAGIVSPLVWEYVHHDIEKIYIKSRINRLQG